MAVILSDDSAESTRIHGVTTKNGAIPNYSNSPNHGETPACKRDEDKVSNNISIENQEKRFTFSSIPKRKKIVLSFCILGTFLTGSEFSMLGLFYPMEAQRKGISLTMIGLVFSIHQLVLFLVSPLIGNFMTRIGIKFVYISGTFVGGCCAILFGLLGKVQDGTPFLVTSLMVWSVAALGFAELLNANMTIATSEFPDHTASALALLKTGGGLGGMLGPIIGGFLFESGGYGLPFYTFGVLLLLNSIVMYKFLPDVQKDTTKYIRNMSVFGLLRSPLVVFSMFVVFIALGAFNVSKSTFAAYVDQFELSGAGTGALYALSPSVFLIVTLLAGCITDSKDNQSTMIIIGHLSNSIGWFINGPSPLLPFITASLWSTAIARVLLGIGHGCLMVPTMKCMVKGAVELNYEKNSDTCALVSGLYNSAYALGGFTGPLAGGALIQEIGFPKGYTLIGSLILFMFLLSVSFFSIRYITRRKIGRENEKLLTPNMTVIE